MLSQGQSCQREQDASSCKFLFSRGFQAEASEPIERSVNVELWFRAWALLPELYDEDGTFFLTELMSGLSKKIHATCLAEPINDSSSYFEIINIVRKISQQMERHQIRYLWGLLW